MSIAFICLLATTMSIFTNLLSYVGIICLTLSCVYFVYVYASISFLDCLLESKIKIYEITWIAQGEINIPFAFHLDALALILTIMISFISFIVIIYSQEYLSTDKYLVRFTNYLSIFCLAMLLLVTSGNYLCLFLSWELVGLASYLLISFWTTRNEANKGAYKAIAINRIGDIFFLFALALMWYQSQTFSIDFLSFQTYTSTTLISFCITIAACAKSAQIILHSWLPEAMEGPTPVSSLLHSATMVTAGVFLLLRSTSYSSTIVCYMLGVIACITAIIASFLGTQQFDLKRIIAYSTCSQIGLMTLSASLGNYILSLYHLVTHAFFKCLLFLSAGSIIHSVNDEQDIRKMGGLITYLPVTFTSMFLASFSLMGFPFFSGFYSKDLLIEHAYFSGYSGILFYLLTSLAAILTVYYSLRLLFTVFIQRARIKKHTLIHIQEPSHAMLYPMLILLLASLFIGFFSVSFFTAPFTYYLAIDNFNFFNDKTIEIESINYPINNFTLLLVLSTCMLFTITLSIKKISKTKQIFDFSIMSFKLKCYIDFFFTYLTTTALVAALRLFNLFDKGILETPLGAQNLWNKFQRFCAQKISTQFYAKIMCLLILFAFTCVVFILF